MNTISLAVTGTLDFIGGMKFWFMALLAALTSAGASWTPGPLTERAELPGPALAWERSVTAGSRAVRLSGVSFSARDCTFRVIDNPPPSRLSLTEALAGSGAVAGINGGYFHKDFRPLGLLVAGGETIHGFERAKLLSGILTVTDHRIALLRAGDYKAGSSVREALQAGPWLVENGKVIAGLNSEKLARRTVVVSDGGDRWAVVATSPLTLAETAEVLALKDLMPGWTVRQALNLDGGSSTALLALSEGRAVLDIPSFGPVRNYLAIVPRRR